MVWEQVIRPERAGHGLFLSSYMQRVRVMPKILAASVIVAACFITWAICSVSIFLQ